MVAMPTLRVVAATAPFVDVLHRAQHRIGMAQSRTALFDMAKQDACIVDGRPAAVGTAVQGGPAAAAHASAGLPGRHAAL